MLTNLRSRLNFGKKLWKPVSILLFIIANLWLISNLEVTKIIDLLYGIEALYLIPIIFLYPLSLALSTWRWKTLIGTQEKKLYFSLLFYHYWKSNVISQFLPGTYSGDFFKWRAVKSSLGGENGSRSIFLDRFSGLAILLLFVGIGSFMHIDLLSSLIKPNVIILILVAGISGVIFLPIILNFIYKNFSPSSNNIVPSDLWFQKKWWYSLGISVLFLLGNVSTFYFGLLAFDIKIPFTILCAIVPIINLFSLVPFPLAGIGVQESIAVIFFSLISVPAEVTTTFLILARLIKISLDLLFITYFEVYSSNKS